MTDKRFWLVSLEYDGEQRFVRDNNQIGEKSLSNKEVVDLLNKLAEENEQLKQQIFELKSLLGELKEIEDYQSHRINELHKEKIKLIRENTRLKKKLKEHNDMLEWHQGGWGFGMIEKRFDVVLNEFDEIEYITDIVDYEDRNFADFLDYVNEMAKENEQLKHRLAISEKANYVTALEQENEQLKHYKEAYGTEIVKIKQTIKDMMDSERTAIGKSVLRQLMDNLEI